MSTVDSIIANYKEARELDRQWWAQRIVDTTVDDKFRESVFKSGNDAEPFRGVMGMRTTDVCLNGVPAIQRVNAGPPTEP